MRQPTSCRLADQRTSKLCQARYWLRHFVNTGSTVFGAAIGIGLQSRLLNFTKSRHKAGSGHQGFFVAHPPSRVSQHTFLNRIAGGTLLGWRR